MGESWNTIRKTETLGKRRDTKKTIELTPSTQAMFDIDRLLEEAQSWTDGLSELARKYGDLADKNIPIAMTNERLITCLSQCMELFQLKLRTMIDNKDILMGEANVEREICKNGFYQINNYIILKLCC